MGEDKMDKKIKFELDKIETARYKTFWNEHRQCRIDKNGKPRFGGIGGGMSIKFTPTGLGNLVECHCEGCNKTEDITNIDSW